MPKIYEIRNIVDEKNRLLIYNAWILPYLTYAIEMYSNATTTQKNRLQKIQNKTLKTLFRKNNLSEIRKKNILF